MTTESQQQTGAGPTTEAEESPRPKPSPLPATRGGLEFRTLEDMWRFANYVHKAGWGPKGSTPESNLVAMEMGAEVGLPAMASIRAIAVINGRPSIWGDVMLALCMRNPIFDVSVFEEILEGEGDKMTATCHCARRGGKLRVSKFNVADAKRAGLWGGMGIKEEWARKLSPWVKSPERMLQMRARAFALRDTFPDVLTGLYAREELPTPDELLNQIDLGDADAAPAKGEPQAETAKPPRSLSELAAQQAGTDPPAKPATKRKAKTENERVLQELCSEGVLQDVADQKARLATTMRLRNEITTAYKALTPDRKTDYRKHAGLPLEALTTIDNETDVARLQSLWDQVQGA